MKHYIGKGKSWDISEAIMEATKELNNPSAIIFSTVDVLMEKVSQLLYEKYKEALIIGTTSPSIEDGNEYNLLVIGFFDDVEIAGGIIEEISSCPVNSIRSIENNIESVHPKKDNTVCIAFSTRDDEEKLRTTLKVALEKYGVGIVGGVAHHILKEGNPKKLYVSYNGKLYWDSCAYLLIRNKTGNIKLYKENIFKKMNEDIHRVTNARQNKTGRVELLELDNNSAIDVYCKQLGLSKKELADKIIFYPIGRLIGDDIYIVGIWKMEEETDAIVCGKIYINDRIIILKLSEYKKIFEQTINIIKNEISNNSLVFSINCSYRFQLYNEEGFWDKYENKMQEIGPHAGVVCSGEFYRKHTVSMTMVCAVFE